MYVIMYVSKNVEQASDMMNVWLGAGVKGLTILESAGMQQVTAGGGGIRSDTGIIFSLSKLMRSQEIHHRTLFSVISDDATLQKVIDRSTTHVGDWSRPDVGILFAWPLSHVYGLDKQFK